MNSNLDTKTEFLVEHNPKYSPISSDAKVLLQNVADNVRYNFEPVQSSDTNSLTFKIETNGDFVDRGVWLNMTNINLDVILQKPIVVAQGSMTPDQWAAAKTANNINFHTKLFEDYRYLALKQFALLNAINTVSITLDGETCTVKDMSEIMPIVANYYAKDAVHNYFDASAADYVYDSKIHADNLNYVPSVSINGDNILVKNTAPTLDINNPFSNVSTTNVNTRTPLFTLGQDITDITSSTAKHQVTLHNLSTFLPFNVFGIIGEETPLYNLSSILIKINFHNDWINRIFSVVKDDNKSRYLFSLRRDANSTTFGDVRLMTRLYKPPQKIANLIDPANPYLIQFPMLEIDDRSKEITFAKNETKKSINDTQYDLRAIPSKVYVAVVPKRDNSDDHMIQNDHYCRFDALTVTLNGRPTILTNTGNSSEVLYNIAKENGLDLNKNTALYLKGFPICLDVSNDLSCPSDQLVGIDSNANKFTLKISGQISRLHTDYKNGNISTATSTELFNRDQKTYLMKVVFVYQAYLGYKMLGKKFSIIESLDVGKIENITGSVDNLYQNFVPKTNVLGGSFLSAFLPSLKGVAKGSFNVIKSLISNKDGIRDKLVDAYKGAGHNNVMGGAFDNHAPILGGRSIENWSYL